jgi:GNAT superfamily N-acetyltransferase
MEVRRVDQYDEQQVRAFYDVLRRAETTERAAVETPFPTEHAMITWLRHDDPAQKLLTYGAYAGCELVGTAWIALPQLDNTDLAWLAIDVPAENRRRGVGTALLDKMVDEIAALGRHEVVVESWIPFGELDDHPYRRFASHHGFVLSNTEIRRDLVLPVDDGFLLALEVSAAPHHASYELHTYTDDMPDDVLASFCTLYNTLGVEAPPGELEFDEEAISPAVFRDREEMQREAKMIVYKSVALDPTRNVAGYSTVSVTLDEPHAVHQWGTLVHPAHRGHRLGLALKVRNLQIVQRLHRDRTLITTCNTESNAYMVGINERLGFEPVEILAAFQRTLA